MGDLEEAPGAGFGLAQPWLLLASGELDQWMGAIYVCVSLDLSSNRRMNKHPAQFFIFPEWPFINSVNQISIRLLADFVRHWSEHKLQGPLLLSAIAIPGMGVDHTEDQIAVKPPGKYREIFFFFNMASF